MLEADSTTTRARTNGTDLSAAGLAWELTHGLLRLAGRRTGRLMNDRIARRRMNRIRHNPAPLRKALRSARNILVVCRGNIVRSPFAAKLLARSVGASPVCISSGGVAAVAGNRSHPTALRIATSHAIDLSRHEASPLDDESVASSDVIFVMDIPLLVAMGQRFPQSRHKVFLLACLSVDAPLEIRDPIDGDDSRFQVCFDHISQAVRPIAGTLRSVGQVP
jgi:protein-tyrosine-phosphatase